MLPRREPDENEDPSTSIKTTLIGSTTSHDQQEDMIVTGTFSGDLNNSSFTNNSMSQQPSSMNNDYTFGGGGLF